MISIDIDKGAKIFKLKNKDGRIYFTVSFIITEHETNKYLVKVKQIKDLIVPSDIISERFQKKDDAENTTEKLIQDYVSLIGLYDKEDEITPEKIFVDSVNYHIIDPDRCENCVFSNLITPHVKKGMIQKTFRVCNNRNNLRNMEQIKKSFDDMKFYMTNPVEVNDNGVCKNHSRKMTNDVETYTFNKIIERDKDIMAVIESVVDNKFDLLKTEDVIFDCGGSTEE